MRKFQQWKYNLNITSSTKNGAKPQTIRLVITEKFRYTEYEEKHDVKCVIFDEFLKFIQTDAAEIGFDYYGLDRDSVMFKDGSGKMQKVQRESFIGSFLYPENLCVEGTSYSTAYLMETLDSEEFISYFKDVYGRINKVTKKKGGKKDAGELVDTEVRD